MVKSGSPQEARQADESVQATSDRIFAIDVLRGGAVLVWGGSVTAMPALYLLPDSMFRNMVINQLSPSIWHGVTLFDLVLPAFLMAVGAALVFDIERRRRSLATNRTLVRRIIWRACLLFLIGLVCEWWGSPSVADMRFTGVFQRIAVCYLVVGIIGLYVRWRVQAGLVAVILLEYWAMLELIEVPGYGAGNYGVEGNVVAFVDRLLLPGRPYLTTWDPQGILSTLPALAITIIGMLLGQRLLHDRNTGGDSYLMILLAGVLTADCGILAGEIVPPNSYMGTPSFVVTSCGIILAVVGLTGLIFHIRLAWLMWPLNAMGRNALVLVVALACVPTVGVSGLLLVQAAVVATALLLYRRRWFITLTPAVRG